MLNWYWYFFRYLQSKKKTNCKGAISSDHTEAAKTSNLSVSYLLRNIFSFCVEYSLLIWGVSRCLLLFVVERHCCIVTRIGFHFYLCFLILMWFLLIFVKVSLKCSRFMVYGNYVYLCDLGAMCKGVVFNYFLRFRLFLRTRTEDIMLIHIIHTSKYSSFLI